METLSNVIVSLKIDDEQCYIANNDIVELNLVENILDFYMSGNITFYDKTGWREKLSHEGGTKTPITITWKEGEETSVEKMFLVYYTEPLVPMAPLENAFVQLKWYFIEPMYSSLTTKHYSKSWGDDTKASTIFESIFKDFLGYKSTSSFKYYEPPDESFNNFSIPNSNIGTSINWLKKRCSGSYSKQAGGYLCFSNSLGSNFVTLPYLIEQEKLKYEREKRTSYTFGADSLDGILNYSIEYPNAVDQYELGGEQSLTCTGDGKKIEVNDITYIDQVQGLTGEKQVKTHGMAKAALFQDISNTKRPVRSLGEPDSTKLKNIQNNNYNLTYNSSLVARLDMKGSSTRYAGMLIDISWKSAIAEDKTDKKLEGLWLVKSITHQFVPNAAPFYRQRLVCVKPGYNTSESTTATAQNVKVSSGSSTETTKVVKVVT